MALEDERDWNDNSRRIRSGALNPKPFLIAVCTYNEVDNIGLLLDDLFKAYGHCSDLLVVDDHSPDGTADVVREKTEIMPNLSLMVRDGAKGRGLASRVAYAHFMERAYSHIIELDGDFSHDPADIRRLMEHSEEVDLVVGSRHMKGSSFGDYPLHRRWMSSMANLFVHWILPLKVHDATNSFLCASRKVFEAVDPKSLMSENFSLFMELKIRCEQKELKVLEIPIRIQDRTRGESKMSFQQMV